MPLRCSRKEYALLDKIDSAQLISKSAPVHIVRIQGDDPGAAQPR